ncbi:hypothetical protein P171DRAFT_157613 [Karstenula rhodostoma CBS 690.94]|uniref:Uncharacterized protein n=1 Tax=Karstenula rhodostoma CBS 690.94 TaxID=1392251 RepID=A0A9P4U6J9_9PLEO|nr:hypothetical protein P171DRAFT_157613 [Karstenula rhodostoma CBS 690.94]
MLSGTKLPASIESLAFIDCYDAAATPVTALKYDAGRALDQLLEEQKNTPGCKGLVEFVHIANICRDREGQATVDTEQLADFVSKQARLSVLCLHQDVPYNGTLAEFARPSLTTFSFRDGLHNVVYTELKRFAEQATKVKAWGGNWSSIALRNHSLRDNFGERAEALAELLKPMEDLDTVALFTSALSHGYGIHDKQAEELAVGRFLRIFDRAGSKIKWIHIVDRDIRNESTWWTKTFENGTTYRAVESKGLRTSLLAEEAVDLPHDVFETRWKLGADLVSTYCNYELDNLRELHVGPLQVADHTRTRLARREDEENITRMRKSYREQGCVRRGQKRGAGDTGSQDGGVASPRDKAKAFKRRKRTPRAKGATGIALCNGFWE